MTEKLATLMTDRDITTKKTVNDVQFHLIIFARAIFSLGLFNQANENYIYKKNEILT